MLGQGSKFYASNTAIKEADLIANTTSIGAFAKSRNMVNKTPTLAETQQKSVPGLKNIITSTITLLVEENEADNAGIDLLEAAFDNGTLIYFGVAKPNTANGIMGRCYVNSFEPSEITNEGEQTVSVGITVDGEPELLVFATGV